MYVTVMAVCAIVVGRQRHTADSYAPSFQVASPRSTQTPSKAFYEAAVGAFPADLSTAQGFEFKRAKVLLAIASIQFGFIVEHQTHLGEYVVLACNDGFHDESRWEPNLDEIQRQERRRLVSRSGARDYISLIPSSGRHTPSKCFLQSHGTASCDSENVRAMLIIRPRSLMRTFPDRAGVPPVKRRSCKVGITPQTCIEFSSILSGD